MKKQTLWLLLSLTTAGLVYFVLRKRKKHNAWEKQRDEVLKRAKKRSYGEFVL